MENEKKIKLIQNFLCLRLNKIHNYIFPSEKFHNILIDKQKLFLLTLNIRV